MKTVLVTGANRGIGLELCRQLKAGGDEVVAVCRTKSDALASVGVRVEEGVDVASEDSVGVLASRLQGVNIDILINNAGILRSESLDDLDFDSIRTQFEVNSLGPLRVTARLLPMMRRGAKVVLVTSRMGSIADNTSGGRYGYRMSKAALNMAGVSLACDLRPQGIAVGIVHPGFVQTEMTSNQGNITADESAACILQRLSDIDLDSTGGFWHANGEKLPW